MCFTACAEDGSAPTAEAVLQVVVVQGWGDSVDDLVRDADDSVAVALTADVVSEISMAMLCIHMHE